MDSPSPPPAPGLSAVLDLPHHEVVRRVGEVASAQGSPVHLVGGMVRDAWLGRTTKDVDVVVSGRGEEIARRLAETLPARFVPLGGKEFAAFRLVGEEFELDLWDREDMTVTEDLARRDLTVNALALRLRDVGKDSSGKDSSASEVPSVVDPFGGLADLEARRLRATTPESFTGDPLRVLRLARFVAELPGFRVEDGTRGLARRAAPGLARVAAERIREELLRLFAAEGAAQGLRELARLGLYPELFLGRAGGPRRSTGDDGEPTAEAPAREMGALPAVADRLRVLADEAEIAGMPAPNRAAARWASALLHLPTGDAAEADGAAHAAVEHLRDLGYLSRRTAEPVLALLRSPQAPPQAPPETPPETRRAGGETDARGEVARRRILHRLGRHWSTALTWWGARGQAVRTREGGGVGAADRESWEATARELLELMREDGPWILDPPRLLTGDEVRELLSLAPGPELGKALERLRGAQVDGRVRTREQAVAWLTGKTGKTPSEKSRRTTSSRHP